MSSIQVRPPFTNLQMELLHLFEREVAEEDLLAIKKMISKYFFDKAASEAEQVWAERGYDDIFMKKILKGEI